MKDDHHFIIGIVLLLLGGGGVAVYSMTRGLRNNNPGNIRLDGTQWQGMKPVQTDGDFVQFISPEYGLRALTHVLRSYKQRGINTVAAIFNRYAPPSENDTRAYVQDVADALGVDANAVIDIDNYLPQLLAAITEHENGLNPYASTTINAGIALA